MKIGINIHQRKRGVRRVLRGGSFINVTGYLRSSSRDRSEPERRTGCDGFRIVVRRRSP